MISFAPVTDGDELLELVSGINQQTIFNPFNCFLIESCIEQVAALADQGKYLPCSIDRAPLRNK